MKCRRPAPSTRIRKTLAPSAVALRLAGGVALGVAAGGAAGGAVARGGELFRDDFSGTSLNAAWSIGTWTLGRTQLGFTPQIAGGVAQLRLDTYNPSNPGGSFRGTEIWTNQQYGLGATGLELEARVRVNAIPDGLVTSFFTYNARTQFNPPLADEIDFEHLSKAINAAPAGSKPILLTTWNDYRVDGSNFGDPNVHNSASVVVPGWVPTQFNTYRIRWLPNRVEWYLNGSLLRTATQAVSTDPQNVRLNFWAPGSDWPAAYASSLVPASNSGANRTYLYDVDWVGLRDAYNPPAAATANRVFTDSFKNGSASLSDSGASFWTTRTQGAASVTETTGDPLRLAVSGAGYPHAQVASAVQSGFNFFSSPIRLTADGIDFTTTAGSQSKSILRFVLASQGLGAGSESEYTVEDALSLRVQADNFVTLGYKLDQANTNSEFNNLLLNTQVSGPVRKVTLTLRPAAYTLLVEHETSATDGTRVVDTFTGNLSIPLTNWRVGTASTATGNSALFLQGQFNNSGAGESMTAMVNALAVDAVRSRWSVDAGGTWGAADRWNSDGVPDFAGANAIFGPVLTADRSVTVAAPVQAGLLQFDSSRRYTVSGSAITLVTPAASAQLNVLSGSHTVSAPLVLSSPTTVAVTTVGSVLLLGQVSGSGGLTLTGPGRVEVQRLTTGAVTVSGGGTLALTGGSGMTSLVPGLSITSGSVDLLDSSLVVRGGDVAAIRQLVRQWWNAGNPTPPGGSGGGTAAAAGGAGGLGSSLATGTGLTTLAVFANTAVAPGVGYFSRFGSVDVVPGDVLIRYTYLGDTDLNGVVNGRDLANTIEGLSGGLTGWQNGDFDYSGDVTLADLNLLLRVLQVSPPALAGPLDVGEVVTGVVPEPGCVVVGVVWAMATLGRRVGKVRPG